MGSSGKYYQKAESNLYKEIESNKGQGRDINCELQSPTPPRCSFYSQCPF